MAASAGAPGVAQGRKPNFIVILADDLGFSDIGPYGGEIATPNLDRLASRGVRFSQFYNCARCCPTRASLLTGMYNHQAGVGHMIQDRGVPSYQGYLNDRCRTIAEVLRPAGYSTLMSGKWHVGESKPHWPLDRGFDRYFGLISGASNYFRLDPGRKMALDAEPYQPSGDGFYMTDAFTSHAVKMISEAAAKPNPFFLYLAYTAPHWPLHAPPEDIEKYRGKYMKGWDVLRAERHERQLAAGLVDKRWKLSPRDSGVPAWSEISEQQRQEWDLRMAVYAAQVDRMDRGIGRVFDAAQKAGRLEDTIVWFVADNGGCAEENIGGERAAKNPVPGGADSFTSYRRPWANASNTPFRYWKQLTHEGGISSPCILAWGTRFKGNSFNRTPGHVMDILPTLADAAGVSAPSHVEGRSLLAAFTGGTPARRAMTGWEHQGHRALRMEDWKLVSRHGTPWELYRMDEDRTELNDLAAKDPARVQTMEKEYRQWAERCGVMDWDKLPKARG
jgi:arylsulfatase